MKSARSRKSVKTSPKKVHPADSVIIQFGVAFIVVAGLAVLMFVVKHYLP